MRAGVLFKTTHNTTQHNNNIYTQIAIVFECFAFKLREDEENKFISKSNHNETKQNTKQYSSNTIVFFSVCCFAIN